MFAEQNAHYSLRSDTFVLDYALLVNYLHICPKARTQEKKEASRRKLPHVELSFE